MPIERLSFEFFPPSTPKGERALTRTCRRLSAYAPEFFSVTYGAGGSTRDRTFNTIAGLCELGAPATPHLSIGMDDDDAVRELLDRYRALGIDRIVALRGDIPSGLGAARQVRYAAELVTLIRAHSGDHFWIEVAAYPETHPDSPTPAKDVELFKRKLDAGANSAITQYFYNTDAYFDFVERCTRAGIDVPIVPGVMPITNYAKLVRFSDGCGAEIPRWIKQRLAALESDEAALKDFGCEVVSRLCERLLAGGAPGLHFYTLNRAAPTAAILNNLGAPVTTPESRDGQ